MILTVIVPTGEVRVPNNREWYQGQRGDWFFNVMNFESDAFPIGKAHEVEVPDDSDSLTWFATNNCKVTHTGGNIPLPRPKKKVKKWQWVYRKRWDTIWQMTSGHYTDEQDMRDHAGQNTIDIAPVKCTEIEVSE